MSRWRRRSSGAFTGSPPQGDCLDFGWRHARSTAPISIGHYQTKVRASMEIASFETVRRVTSVR
ncbi:MAG: hypothetical protein EA381_13965 [Planctomycetaceae bacterium]|nr:MAG: hypothetical protein EA381_13965 [Planctomycetaceae bacterium]